VAELAACCGLANPPNKNPAARFLGGISVRTGLQRILNMNAYQDSPKNAINFQPSAFSPWPFAAVQPITAAGQYVARRFRVDPALADLVADLAGIGSEVR
jgi:hypothetical protein